MDVQIAIALITLVGSAGIAWGVSANKLKALEIRAGILESAYKTDHDILIEIKTKVDMLLQGMTIFQANHPGDS
jgi:hypothetical protein